MSIFAKLFKKRHFRKREKAADRQFLDAIEIIRESAEIYLDLLAEAQQNGNTENATRLNAKLNNNFEYFSKNWNGEIKVIHTIASSCYVPANEKMLKII